jgi:hypothetical protein
MSVVWKAMRVRRTFSEERASGAAGVFQLECQLVTEAACIVGARTLQIADAKTGTCDAFEWKRLAPRHGGEEVQQECGDFESE